MNGIGTLQENSLHADLKAWCAQSGDQIETIVDGYVIDVMRGDLLVEVQTGNFSVIKRKLTNLLKNHSVRLVYPIPYEKWILRLAKDGVTILGRRKSPKRGKLEDLFQELVYIPSLVANPNFSLEILLIRMEVVWVEDGRGSWRRKGRSIQDQHLIEVVSRHSFLGTEDYRIFIPPNLPMNFTVRDLAKASGQPQYMARKMAYCLREMGMIEPHGKSGRWIKYNLSKSKYTLDSIQTGRYTSGT